MNIVGLQVKRYIRHPGTFLTILLLGMGLLFLSYTNSNSTFAIGITDLDNTEVSRWLYDGADNHLVTVKTEESSVNNLLSKKKIMANITIPSGYTHRISEGLETPLTITLVDERSLNQGIINAFNDRVNVVMHVLNHYPKSEWLEQMESVKSGPFSVEYNFVSQDDYYGSKVAIGITGIILMSILYLSSSLVNQLKSDKDENRIQRVLVSPIKQSSYVFQQVVSFVLVIMFVITSFVLIAHSLLGANFGSNIVLVLIVFSLFTMFATVFSTIGLVLIKDIKNLGNMINLIVLSMTMLGGCFWPIEIMPESMQYIAKFMPTYWAKTVIRNIILEGRITTTWFEVGTLLLLVLTLLVVASNKRIEISNEE